MIMKELDHQIQGEVLLKKNTPGIVILDNGQGLVSLMELLVEEGVSIYPVLSPWLLGRRRAAVK